MILPVPNLLIPNLAELGIEMDGDPDLITIWKTPYPVLTNYIKLCERLGVKPFGGGTYKKQGPLQIGRINSGYRSLEHNSEVGGRTHSPHMFGVAIDPWWNTHLMCEKAAKNAVDLFNRIILYPKPFIHLDLTDSIWNLHYSNGQRFAVADSSGNYKWFEDIDRTIQFYHDVYKDVA